MAKAAGVSANTAKASVASGYRGVAAGGSEVMQCSGISGENLKTKRLMAAA
jgi:hypothetical protein